MAATHQMVAAVEMPRTVAPSRMITPAPRKPFMRLPARFTAWAAWELVDESALFDAHDNSALRVPLVIPQGIWAIGISAFVLMCAVLLLESLLALLTGNGAQLDELLGSRTLTDETEEALEAVAMARGQEV